MRPAIDRPSSHLVRLAAAALIGVFVAACGGSGSASPSAAATVAESPATVRSEAPSASVAPSAAPTQIFVLGKAGTSGPQIVMFITATSVEVRVGTGSGATLKLRTFNGAGVTNFGAYGGATVDTPLTETGTDGAATGLGALSQISATITCGDQQPGTSTIAVTGVQALGTAGGKPALVFVTIGPTSLQVSVDGSTTEGSFFTASGAGLTTLVPGGGSATGDVKESVTGGATPHVLHVAGSATCGTTVTQ